MKEYIFEMSQEKMNKVVLANGSVGVIRYIGPILDGKNEEDIWYGIEWADPSRGKHDGSHAGKRYFQTKHPTGGSFVRENKIDFGVDIWTAVDNKYFKQDEDEGEKNELFYNNFDMAKQVNTRIHAISLAENKISSLSTSSRLNETFPRLTEIDLGDNLISSWSEVFQLLDAVKNLRILNVTNNRLSLPSKQDTRTYPNITGLILNKLEYNWNDILQVLKHFPNVVELKVCFNQIVSIDELLPQLVDRLKVLDLESNPINDWPGLKKLGELKELETLYANNIGLSYFEFNDCEYNFKTSSFPKLKSIALNDNKISSWKAINEMNKLKELTEVRMKNNPLNETETPESIRYLMIAKLDKLYTFNRTVLENRTGLMYRNERKMAEIDYLKRYGKEWLEIKKEQPLNRDKMTSFLLEHPRYELLSKKYGEVEEGETDVKPDTLKSKLVSVSILNESSGQKLDKKLPFTIEVKRLKMLVANLFKLPNLDSIKLFYKSVEKGSEFEMDNDLRVLDFYAIENGDTIIIRQ